MLMMPGGYWIGLLWKNVFWGFRGYCWMGVLLSLLRYVYVHVGSCR
jgi:hypothetical protein